MTYFLINLILALIWASLQLFRPIDLIGGFVIGYGLIWLTRHWLGDDAARYIRRLPLFVGFVMYYLGELLTSTWQVTRMLFRDQHLLKPGIIAFPLNARTDLEITLLNNLLIFTPGTLGIDLSEDRATLYIHFIDVPDPEVARARIRNGIERRLLEVLR
jgi:multicomponent Na+:H+ antiporter subunit E